MEGTHVWALGTEELDLRRLIILRRVDFDVIRLVFLDFLGLWMKMSDDDEAYIGLGDPDART